MHVRSLETSVNRWCASGACARTTLFADAAKYATQLLCLLVWQLVRDPAVSFAVNHMLSRNKLWSIVAHLVGNVSGACLCKTLPHNGMGRWAVAGVLLLFLTAQLFLTLVLCNSGDERYVLCPNRIQYISLKMFYSRGWSMPRSWVQFAAKFTCMNW